jgi:hypothetical protein
MSHVAQHQYPRQRIAAVSRSAETGRAVRPAAPAPRPSDARAAGNGAAVDAPVDPGLVALLTTAAEWRCRLETALHGVGLSSAEFCVLRRLAMEDDALTAGELSAASPHVEGCTAAAVDGLAARAMIEWSPVRRGEGVPRLRLTDAGRVREAEGAQLVDDVSAEFAAAIPGAARLLLHRLALCLADAA